MNQQSEFGPPVSTRAARNRARRKPEIGKSAARVLAGLAAQGTAAASPDEAEALIAHDLAGRRPDGVLAVTAAGRAYLARLALAGRGAPVDPFLGQHIELAQSEIATEHGRAVVSMDAAESPLVWLARRKGRDGRALIEPVQLQAGERLRADFTRAQLMPRVTANWTSAVAQDRRGGNRAATFSDAVIAARQRLRQALDAVGPEFIGLLLDVCCFLKRLEDIERERGWPARSAKVVLQLALDRLARHYGYAGVARGRARGEVRTWLAEDAAFAVGECAAR
jgi:hypothetical protein